MVKLDDLLNTAVEAGLDYVILIKVNGEIAVAVGLNAFSHKINSALNEYLNLMKNMGISYEIEFYNVKGEKITFKDIPMVFTVEKEDNTLTRKGAYM